MKKLVNIILTLAFLAGVIIFSYPVLSEQWNKYHQSQAIASYDQTISELSQEDYDSLWKTARQYNAKILQNSFLGDSFTEEEEITDEEYNNVLNIGNTGIMGYISIPKISQKIPIYHGTSEGVLQIAAGHMYGTKLPIGGESTHSVIAAHRGLPSAKLFSDVDQLKNGDRFYIHVLDQVLAYEVDQILPMIEKDNLDELTNALSIEEGQDYITLFTCTPYGINSHRLLVRGHRVAYSGEEDEAVITEESMSKPLEEDFILYILTIVLLLMFVDYIARGMKKMIRKK